MCSVQDSCCSFLSLPLPALCSSFAFFSEPQPCSSKSAQDSRGGHFREDYPERHAEFDEHTLAYMTEFGKVTYGKRPVDMSLYEAKNANYEKFGMIERKY